MGRILVVFLLASAVLAGGGLWYLQTYAYYDRLEAQGSFALTPIGAAAALDFPITGFEGIDSDSSPIRFRACFTTTADPATLTPYERPTPLIAPGWFDCFNAPELVADLASGAARAVLAQSNIRYGIDRVAAIYGDGRGYAWHQLNRCGLAHYDGDPVPPDCPAPPSTERP